MLREFFCSERCVFVGAWGGLFLVLAHACVHGWVKFALNEWYGTFYDILGDAAALARNASTVEEEWAGKRDEVATGLGEFCKIAIVAVVVMPIAKFIRSMWSLEWRLALTNAYMRTWDANRPPIEGASQRVQEDAQRFAKGTELTLTVGLDCILTLAIFVPVLLQLGDETHCPTTTAAFCGLGRGWLVGLAVVVAAVGFGITLLVGQRLVGLEVANQVVEAKLRMDLVLLETSPERICVAVHNPPPQPTDVVVTDDIDRHPTHTFMPPMPWFVSIVASVRDNYKHLYLNFTALNLWLAIFEQFATILPYLVVAPLLFSSDAATRVSMGTLIQVSNAFDKVFTSLNVVADQWASINEFRSVLRRLRQFELNLYHSVPHPNRRQPRSPPFGVLSEISLTHLPSASEANVALTSEIGDSTASRTRV